MDHTEFLDAVELLDWLEIERKSSGGTREKIPILQQELRFLSTFLKCTANRCTENEFLKDLLIRIGDVRKDINELNDVLNRGTRKSAVDGAFGDISLKINLLKPWVLAVQKVVLRSSGSETRPLIDEAGVGFIDSGLDLVEVPELSEIQMQVSSLSVSRSLTSDELIKFVDSLLENLEGLLAWEANLLRPSLNEGVKVLIRWLRFVYGLICLTAYRCNDHDKLNQLFTLVQAMTDSAAYLANFCLTNKMDEDMINKLDFTVSRFALHIDPSNQPAVREIYVGVLKASISSESNICRTDETSLGFVECLLENTSELLNRFRHIEPVKDQIEILHVELRSLGYFLTDLQKDINPGRSVAFLPHVEVMAVNAGYVICSLLGGVNQEIADEMRLAQSKLLEMFKHGKMLIRKSFLNIEKAKIDNFPRTGECSALDLLLQNLKELLNDRSASIELLKDHIQIIQSDLQFLLPSIMELQSFLSTITEQHHQNKQLEGLWRCIMHVFYEVQYVIDLFMVKDGPVLHHMLWFSDLIKEIKLMKTDLIEKMKLIKIEINETQISNKDKCRLQEPETPKISSSRVLSACGIDEEMVGFKDEVKQVKEELVNGPRKLLIVSIVGMPGRGKTFLAQRIYNDPTIKNHFYVRAWCSVSQVYESKELLIKILSQIKKSSEEMTEKTDEELAAMLFRSLKKQRYLIVLDDIWDINWWKILQRSFTDDDYGSRIVFTTRHILLASQAKSDSKLYELRPLSPTESWELLQRKIFQQETCPTGLCEIGEKIATSCGGLPLAIVVVAGVLTKMGKVEERWRQVADSLSSYINSESDRWWMNIIDLSYKYLPDYLKPCFLYFGAFLPAEEIPMVKLTWLWIAEGFVQEKNANLEGIAEGNASLECIAEGYLLDLIERSLIAASKRRSSGGFKACLIHELIRNFCIVKAEEHKFLQLIEADANLLSSSSPSSYKEHRLSVHYRRRMKIWNMSSGPYVRSLLLFAPGRLELGQAEVSSIILGFKLLKVLDLMCIDLGATFPEGIASLALLRYLAVSGSFNCLPSSIVNLGKLENFFVRAVDLISLSFGDILKNMTKLRHLHIDVGVFLAQSSSHNHSQLDSLQTLSTPSFSCGDDMEVLRLFPHLKKLSCTFEESWDFSGLSILEFLHELDSLKISYHGMMRYPWDEFSLPRNIKKLTMSGFRLQWERISIIRKLHNLEVLKLLSEAFEGEEWNMEKDEVFPKLKFFKLESLDIGKWTAFDRGDDHFPLLEQLILEDCVQLEEIIFLEDIPTLKMIQVGDCSHSLEESMNQTRGSLRELGNEDLQIIIMPREEEISSDDDLI